jgi:hypothetical protein
MKSQRIDLEAERLVSDLSADMLHVAPAECLACYLDRQLTEFGCNGTHRFSTHFRDTTAPRSTALIRTLSAMGACCCDCEVLMNAYVPASQLRAVEEWDDDGYELEAAPTELPPCLGVRRGSTRPCALWSRPR